jgi:hypothetical protein
MNRDGHDKRLSSLVELPQDIVERAVSSMRKTIVASSEAISASPVSKNAIVATSLLCTPRRSSCVSTAK